MRKALKRLCGDDDNNDDTFNKSSKHPHPTLSQWSPLSQLYSFFHSFFTLYTFIVHSPSYTSASILLLPRLAPQRNKNCLTVNKRMRMKTAIMTKIKMMMTMSHFPSDYVHKMHKCLFILFKQVYTHDINKIIQGISLSLSLSFIHA